MLGKIALLFFPFLCPPPSSPHPRLLISHFQSVIHPTSHVAPQKISQYVLITDITRIPFATACIPSVFNLFPFNLCFKNLRNFFGLKHARTCVHGTMPQQPADEPGYFMSVSVLLNFLICLSVTHMPTDLREVNKA